VLIQYKLLVVIRRLLIIIVSVNITYAWLSWSGVVNISGTSECLDVNYVKGQDIGSDSNPANFSLASTYTEGLSSVIKVNLKDTYIISNGTGNLPIYNNIEINNEVKQLTVYIWIDGSLVNNDNSNDILSSVYKENISMSIESGDK
jgi:hypothetical protein